MLNIVSEKYLAIIFLIRKFQVILKPKNKYEISINFLDHIIQAVSVKLKRHVFY